MTAVSQHPRVARDDKPILRALEALEVIERHVAAVHVREAIEDLRDVRRLLLAALDGEDAR